jgi:uncharacterized membrane protein
MSDEYFMNLFLGVLIAVSIFAVPILLGMWWAYKSSKKILGGEETRTERKEYKIRTKIPLWKTSAKYLIHGLLFYVLFLVLSFIWAFILVTLVTVGAFIGLIIGLAILVFILGGINSFLTDLLWFPTETSWKSVLFHGSVLLIVLLLVNVIIVAIPTMVLPNITTTIITFITAAFVDGYVAKKVASMWKE